jgi:hypothetical protein
MANYEYPMLSANKLADHLREIIDNIEARGEQPDSQAMPADGALRGDVPLSSTSDSEVRHG